MKKTLTYLLLFIGFFVTSEAFAQPCPPPGYPTPSDDCPAAPPLCIDLNGYCATLSSNNVQQNFPGCPSNALNNDTWFSFIAGTSTIDIQVVPSNCQQAGTMGMQGAIYEGGCNGPAIATQCDCVTTPFNLSSNNYIPGNTYYVVFDGCAGNICDFQVNVLQGSTLPIPPAPPGAITGPQQVCPGATTNYAVDDPTAAIYEWSLIPAIGSISGTPGGMINVNWTSPGTAQLCVTSTNACGLIGGTNCIPVTSALLPQEHEYYNLCIGDCVPCAGQQFCAPTGPLGSPVTLQNWLGCDSVVVCHITGIPVIQNNVGQVTLCAPNVYNICGTQYSQTDFVSHTCENASWQGCDSTVIVDLAILGPDVVIGTPPVLGCGAGATVTLSAINSNFSIAPGGTFTGVWTGPGIVGPNNNPTVTVNQSGQYCYTITSSRNGVSCTDQGCVTVTQNAAVPPTPTVAGPLMPCQGTTVNYTVTPNGTPVPTSYQWTTPNGEPITQVNATTWAVTWNSPTGGQLCVSAVNGCGPSVNPACIPITVLATPATPVINGLGTACTNTTSQTYSVSNVQSGVTYQWTVPTGASFSGSGSSINVNFTGAMAGAAQVCVTALNNCDTLAPVCVPVTITAAPTAPSLNGPTTVCSSGGNYDFSVNSPQAGVNFIWSAPPNAVITGTGANVSINFNGANTGQVCVTASNTCGNNGPVCQTVTVVPAPTATISGSGAFCQGSGGTVNLSVAFTSTGPWNFTYTNGGAPVSLTNITNNPYTLTVNQPGTYTLTALSTASSSCTGTVSGSAVVTENPAPTATLSGTGSICQGSGETAPLTITLTGTAPWSVDWTRNGAPQAPLTVNTSPFTWSIIEAQAGNIVLTDVMDANGCDGTASGNATVTLNAAPTVSMIETDCDATSQFFTVSFTINGGDPATYAVIPNTGTLAGNVFTSNQIPSGDGYSFLVTDGNGCDTITVSDNAVVCNCVTAVGSMDLTPVEVCGNGPVQLSYNNANQNSDGNDILVFILHNGSAVNIVPPIHSATATALISFQPNTMTYGTTYYLSAVVGNSLGFNNVDLNDPCVAIAQGTPVTFYEIPEATLSGSTAICEGEDANLEINFTGDAPWSVTVSDGLGNVDTLNGITANPYTFAVDPTATTNYTLTGMSDNNCDGTASGSAAVTVNTAVSVAGFSVECNATSTAYTISFTISGGDPASYEVTGVVGNIVNGVFTSDPISAGVGYNLTVDDANGCAPVNFAQSQVICDCNTEAGQMDLALVSICGDFPAVADTSTGVELDADDVLTYVLHTGSSNTLGNIIASSLVPEFAFLPGSMAYGTTYYISAVAGTDDGNGNVDQADPCISVAPGTPVVFYEMPTAAFSSSAEVCPGEAVSIDLTGDSPWNLTVNGQLITGIIGTPYSFQPAAGATSVVIAEVSDEHCTNTAPGAATVTIHQPPTIAGIDETCNGTGTGFTVCIDIAGGDPSCYIVTPSTGTINGSQFCSDDIPTGQGYNFQVTDCHGCPAVTAQAPVVDCSCITTAGSMLLTPLQTCGTQQINVLSGVYQNNETLDPDDALCFMLHSGDNQPIVTNSTGLFGFQAGNMTYGTQYFISAVAGNDDGTGCVDFGDVCLSISQGVPVTFYATPTAVLAGSPVICAGETAALTITLTGVAPWTIQYENALGNMATATADASPFTLNVSPTASNVYNLVSVEDANCTGTVSGNATVTVNEAPEAINETVLCDPTGTTYTVTFTILGGEPSSYFVMPAGSGSITAGSFTSNPIPSGSTYNFQIDDANGCGPFVVDGIKVCDCNTDAGTMVAALVEVCIGETAVAQVGTPALPDANDVVVYYLHTNAGNTVGTVIATNSTPSFTFQAGMTAGTTYYISAVVGNNNGTGGVDLNDPCLDVALGTPVVFNALPTIAIAGTTAICEGQSTDLTLTTTGTGPFTVNYTLNGLPQTLNLPAPGPITQSVTPAATATFTLVSILDEGTGCTNTSTQSVTITVNPGVTAGISNGDLAYCDDEVLSLDLDNQLMGADPNGTWTGPAGVVPGGSVSIGVLPAGTYPFTYTVNGTAPCPSDEATVNLTIHPVPVADAGNDENLNCDITSVTLGGNGTTPNLTYAWTGNGLSDPQSATPTATQPGTYTLTVTSAFGCSASDEVEVDQSVTTPEPFIVISDVSCFGESDGYLVVDSVANGDGPYLYSLNGSTFLPAPQFTNLAPGQYALAVMDAAGCENTVTITVAEPEQVTVEIVGDFATNDPVINLGDELELTIVSTPVATLLDTIVWSTGGIDSCRTCPSINVMPVQQTTFSVMVESGGCRAEDNLTVFVEKKRPVYIPSAFSPNEDGLNDLFRIFPGETVLRVKSFLVFNRWGETVYEQYGFDPNDPAAGWNGEHRGETLNPAVFTYFAEIEFIDNSVEIFEGDVSLIR